MKKDNFFKVFSIFLIVSYLLSACAGAPASAPTSNGGGGKPQLRQVVYTGTVESIVDDQWTINGITVTVDPTLVRDGPFGVGDTVKVEGLVNEDGSLTVSRLEAANPDDVSTLPELGEDDNANSNDANANDDNSNESNANEANANASNTNDDNGNPSNANDDNGNDINSNDDNSNDGGANSNDDDDNSDDSNSNDDDGANSNDDGDNGNDSNSNDDDDEDDNDDNSND